MSWTMAGPLKTTTIPPKTTKKWGGCGGLAAGRAGRSGPAFAPHSPRIRPAFAPHSRRARRGGIGAAPPNRSGIGAAPPNRSGAAAAIVALPFSAGPPGSGQRRAKLARVMPDGRPDGA